MAQQRCYESLTWAGAENLMIFGKNIKDNFRFYEELHDMDWRVMMRETLPIFLLPAILNTHNYDELPESGQELQQHHCS
jgi:hypothetical protein